MTGVTRRGADVAEPSEFTHRFLLRFIRLSCIHWVGDFPNAIHKVHGQAFVSIEDLAIRFKQYDISLDFVSFNISDLDFARVRGHLKVVETRLPTIGMECSLRGSHSLRRAIG